MYFKIIILLLFCICCSSSKNDKIWDNDHKHPLRPQDAGSISNYRDFLSPPGKGLVTDWQALGQQALGDSIEQARRLLDFNHNAKNAIFMMGDGMGISTLTAARVYKAQSRNITGDDAILSWERMPYMALSKTYATDLLVPDSANTATAMMCGEKCREKVICGNQLVVQGNCSSLEGNLLKSVLHHAIEAGKWTGFITTSSITEASPSVNYAHSPSRNWETDSDIPSEERACPDIASQLIDVDINRNIRVILGGGRIYMTPNTEADPEYQHMMGKRADNRSLIEEWKSLHSDLEPSKWAYVQNSSEFDNINTEDVEYLMGLFNPNKMTPEKDRLNPEKETWGEPSLTEMVQTAIKILSKSPNGYFLFVEGAQIDNGHHENNAFRALNETVSLSDAVDKAQEMTSEDDTLIVVTADHSHVFSVAGYPAIYTNIFEYNDDWERGWGFQYGEDGKPYTTLLYSNGPGYFVHRTQNGNVSTWHPRKNIEQEKEEDVLVNPDTKQDAMVPRDSETHAGEDVAIFATGPMSYLLQGAQEQHYISHVLMYALCLGENKELCDKGPPEITPPCSTALNLHQTTFSMLVPFIMKSLQHLLF